MTLLTMNTDWAAYARKALAGERLTMEEGLAVLEADNGEVLPIMHAAFGVRKHFYGTNVKLNMIINAKSGLYSGLSSVTSGELRVLSAMGRLLDALGISLPDFDRQTVDRNTADAGSDMRQQTRP